MYRFRYYQSCFQTWNTYTNEFNVFKYEYECFILYLDPCVDDDIHVNGGNEDAGGCTSTIWRSDYRDAR